jgi:NAD-dependent dihydropyrimidine dehydrogenase PreA subunit
MFSGSYVLRGVHRNESMCLRLCGGCRFVCLVHSREERIDIGSDDKASADLA